jgi:hypothetical protein
MTIKVTYLVGVGVGVSVIGARRRTGAAGGALACGGGRAPPGPLEAVAGVAEGRWRGGVPSSGGGRTGRERRRGSENRRRRGVYVRERGAGGAWTFFWISQ